MKKQVKKQLYTRLKSLAWRIGMVALAMGISFTLENLTAFGLSGEMTVIAGLVLGEVSKHLNNKYDLEKYLTPAQS